MADSVIQALFLGSSLRFSINPLLESSEGYVISIALLIGSGQLLQKGLGFPQINRVEALGELVVDLLQWLSGYGVFALTLS